MAQARYQYETSPRKLEPNYNNRRKQNKSPKLRVVEELPRQKIHVSKEQRKKQIKATAVIGMIFLLLLTISCRNSQIDKKFNNIQNQKKQLASLQKENEQLKVSIENSTNLSTIAKAAKEELGMQKLNSKQTVYITLPKKDYVEVASEKVVVTEEKTNWFKNLLNKILNF